MTTPTPPERRGIFTPELLDRCISCGFCLPACPTYAVTRDEASSPRGRISLMRALETGQLSDGDPTLTEQASFCLGCRACEPVCPAGVRYGALLEEWRDHQWTGQRTPWLVRPLTWAVNRRWRIRLAGLTRRHARARTDHAGPHLMLGCVERLLFPGVSRAVARLRPELDIPTGQGCCGALHAHNGQLDRGRRLARELGDQLPGTIVTTAGGCAAHLSDVLGRDRVVELSEYLTRVGVPPLTPLTVDGRRARVAVQDSCHLRNGMGVFREPRDLVSRVADLVELPHASTCCGAAGSYSVLRPRDSRRVLDPKLAEIDQAGVDFVVVVNPGCQRQLATGLRRSGSPVRVLHLAELLDRATTG
ncbi:MAG TPA: (Fe-S)-binding protein [Mycobacteriales bacterium]|jgi:Fe-S oxidoreductase